MAKWLHLVNNWIQEYQTGSTCKQISNKYQVSYYTVYWHLREQKIFSPKVYSVNDAYFDDINATEKAYWLGYLMGDGSISALGTINLSSNDRDHLLKFANCIQSNHKVGKNSIAFRSPHMAATLSKYGVIPGKTYKQHSMELIPEIYKVDYIRGLIDSDGWVCSTSKSCVIGLCSSTEDILREVDLWFSNTFNIKLHKIILKHNLWGKVFMVSWGGGAQCAKICNVIYYQNCLCLSRKMASAVRIIEALQNRLNRKTCSHKYIWRQPNGKFVVEMYINGKKKNFGTFNTEHEALTVVREKRKFFNLDTI